MTPFQAIAALVLAGGLSGCMTTRIATVYDCDGVVNDPNSTRLVTAYFWGLKQPTDIKPPCDPRSNHLNSVTVTNTFGHFLLSLVTVGIVTKQRVSWCCAPYMPAVDTLGMGPAAPSQPLSAVRKP
ncbi:hypothetical protein KBK19_16305 [Microvirga sp. STR05]|uniref:Lipoprotein n=1 Tax=Hymenobacter duratus TaxID=2771356 RepID=A0ABR8JKH3_9BACT|nr:hypothetical protein [Hymenobacter duratus]MBD2716607.1 hypothetical protein [Hymenobacter duratus]MBR7951522.1 hypothetical protein [Microvirga sp. STR05]